MLFAQIPLCDVVEPLDFEELLALYQSVIERDPLRHILEFAFDSIQLQLVRRCVRTVAPIIPEHGSVCIMYGGLTGDICCMIHLDV